MLSAIDLFAGAGGFTAGARRAGLAVVWAANHWPLAVEVHEANHPSTAHTCQDLLQADWRYVPDHEVLLASPACQGHSQAGQPGRSSVATKHQADRNTAWAVIGCAEAKRPAVILVENVLDFYRWPLYAPWRDCLTRLGYEVEEHDFDAADFGVPQNRRRAIVTARLGRPLRLRAPDLDEHRGFESCIDWTDGTWSPVSSKPPGVRRRVRAARDRGIGPRFLTHYVTGHRGRELTRPIGCITTKDQWAVVDGRRMRMLTVRELCRGMTFPDDYALPEARTTAVRLLGNAIPVTFAEELCRQVAA